MTDRTDDQLGGDLDRRAFLKRAAMGAGLAGSAATGGLASTASATPSSTEPPIQRTQAHKIFQDAPITEFEFPAQGADLFAKACKDEGLAALFCCPGNYSIVTAMAILTLGFLMVPYRPLDFRFCGMWTLGLLILWLLKTWIFDSVAYIHLDFGFVT